jgi:ABC-type hemin transport system ATPase subunit
MKVMLGLLQPTSGEVLVDGIPLAVLGARAYREQVATVMQDDQLLSGSVADNICFFDAGFEQEQMVLCAQMAGVHDEIMGMPMAYNSLVGDMGSSLSGGQKQRVLLARALYRKPRSSSWTRGRRISIWRTRAASTNASAGSASHALASPIGREWQREQIRSFASNLDFGHFR